LGCTETSTKVTSDVQMSAATLCGKQQQGCRRVTSLSIPTADSFFRGIVKKKIHASYRVVSFCKNCQIENEFVCLFLFIKISSSLQKPQQPKKIFKSIVTSQVILWRASGLKTSSQQGRAVLGHTNTPWALQPFASCCNCTVRTRRQQPDKHKTRFCFFATFNKGSVPGGDTWRTRPCL